MIHFGSTGGVVQLAQELVPPRVYLDHWALREISESEQLSTRLSCALKLGLGW